MDASLLINLVSGVLGGNVAGGLLKKMSLGFLGNSLAGLVGGSLGGTIVTGLLGTGAAAAGSYDIGAILSQVAGGGVGGGVVMVIVGQLRQMLGR